MRMPEDRRCSEVLREPWERLRFLWAFNDAMLVLITCAMLASSGVVRCLQFFTAQLQSLFFVACNAIDVVTNYGGFLDNFSIF
jgi:hypothetical protein